MDLAAYFVRSQLESSVPPLSLIPSSYEMSKIVSLLLIGKGPFAPNLMFAQSPLVSRAVQPIEILFHNNSCALLLSICCFLRTAPSKERYEYVHFCLEQKHFALSWLLLIFAKPLQLKKYWAGNLNVSRPVFPHTDVLPLGSHCAL